ncbi:amino acid transporter [Salipiger pallidus]|uniref:Amino acid transporter n=1 Tax=Salipiger pallidus TaxID=1775170 RepID=A0A8J2ZI29_9RHOB|nr:LysE/ArgO family amino acid transporter [Salipiger pallidus]GGG65879.1 amino acid transporter [Salipiger pallidus]
MLQSMLAGLGLGLSLILAIGAQNAFVLRQGLARSHVFAVCLVCALSDALLILAGVTGFGSLSQAAPWFETAMRWFGAAFLLWYGARSFLAAWRGGESLKAGASAGSLRQAVLTCLALTWLNPHVYLDTVVLLGSVSAQYDHQAGFAAGAMAGSFLFFFTLGYGARLLAPVFARPRAWQMLDAGIGVVMWAIAAKLILGA